MIPLRTRAPAGSRHRAVGERADRARGARPRDLAADRSDRLRRPPAPARGPRADRLVRPCYSCAPRWRAPPRALNTAVRARYTPVPARDSLSGAPKRRSPLRVRGAAVFENSTACAPIGPALRRAIDRCVQVRQRRRRLARRTAPEQTSSIASGRGLVYGRSLVRCATTL